MNVRVADVEYGPQEVRDIIEGVIQLRDAALKNALFDVAVMLSHTAALLALFAEMMETTDAVK